MNFYDIILEVKDKIYEFSNLFHIYIMIYTEVCDGYK